MEKNNWKVWAKAFVLFQASAGAQASSLNGASVAIDWIFPNLFESIGGQVVTVGPNVEVSCPDASTGIDGSLCNPFFTDSVTFDIGSDSIAYHMIDTTVRSTYGNAEFNGYRFAGLGAGGLWDHVVLETNISGLTLSRIAFDGLTLWVNLAGLNFEPEQQFDVTLVAAPTPVPVPSALWLLFSAVGGIFTLPVLKKKDRPIRLSLPKSEGF